MINSLLPAIIVVTLGLIFAILVKPNKSTSKKGH